jgi:predicted transcriptional regulator
MSTLTIRLPEDKHARLRELARQRGMSLNRLMDELSTTALVQYDTEMRFRALAAKGSPKAGLRILDKLDRAYSKENSQRENA